MVFFVPLIFVAALNSGDYAPFANRESLGRLVFNLAMIAVAALLVMLLRRGSPLMRLADARAPRTWAVRLHGLWFTALVALPLGMAALAAMGYFVAAAYFYKLAVGSVRRPRRAAALRPDRALGAGATPRASPGAATRSARHRTAPPPARRCRSGSTSPRSASRRGRSCSS